MVLEIVGWSAATVWVAVCGYYVANAEMKLSLWDLLRMMPQWCELTSLSGKHELVLTPEASVAYFFGTAILLSACWYLSLDRDVKAMSDSAVSIDVYVTAMVDEDQTEKALLEGAACLANNMDLEYQHCAASLAANNETPGQRVGGEAEWATGETSSEEEDATREITGARVRTAKHVRDEQILNFHQQPIEEYVEKKISKEPHLSEIPETDETCST